MILGVPAEDAGIISKIIGERMVLTEVAAYQDLAAVLSRGLLQNPRSAVIAVYALCGFAHFASMAIFVGDISALVPDKTRIVSEVAFRALLAATLACFLTACVAEHFYKRVDSVGRLIITAKNLISANFRFSLDSFYRGMV